MRVVYDVSVLGIAHRHPSARAGVYRVVDRVLRGVHAALPGQVAVSAVEALRTLGDVRRYLAARPELADVPLVPPTLGERAVSALDRVLDVVGEERAPAAARAAPTPAGPPAARPRATSAAARRRSA